MRRFRWVRRDRLSSEMVRSSGETLEIRNLLSATTLTATKDNTITTPEAPELDHVPGELLVQFNSATTAKVAADVAESLGFTVRSTIHTAAMKAASSGVLLQVGVPQSETLEQAIARLSLNPRVEFAEPNYIYRPAFVSNDTNYINGNLWGTYSADNPPAGPAGTTNQYGSGAEQAWRDGFVGSSKVFIGVIDTGVQVSHPDLAQNIWVNPFETAGDGIDNDGNGYIDDINGWDFYSNDNSVYDSVDDDHGTHVAGTIAGVAGNGSGVAGVSWNATLITAKFLGAGGGSTLNAVRAVDYLTDLKNRHGMDLVASNNSWGGGGYSQSLLGAIIRHAKSNILFVAAAGNDGTNNDSTANYPSNYNTTIGTPSESAASYDGVIAVASITSSGGLSSFSQYGLTTVDIGAPGSGIYSTVPFDGYGFKSGTSMATPHVTGAVALFTSIHSTTPDGQSIKNAILSSAVPTTSLAGKVATGGRLNVYNAIRSADFVYLDQEKYSSSSLVNVSVSDSDANLNAGLAETLTVRFSSSVESAVDVTLTESGANTGIFLGSIQLVVGAATSDGLLQIAAQDVVTASYLGLNDTAIIDEQGPVITRINAIPQKTSASISWQTDTLASTTVIYGTAPFVLNSTANVPGFRVNHAVSLPGLTPDTAYFYRVISVDENGNSSTSALQAFKTLAAPQILFVDDDEGSALETHYINALDANNLTYEVWDVSDIGTTPLATDLDDYSMVIWNTGFVFGTTTSGLQASEQNAISTYLDGGGRIFVSGQDILFDGVTTSFQQNYLKVSAYVDDQITTAHTETGVAGHPIGDGLILPVTLPPGGTNFWVDAVSPASDAQAFLRHGVGTATYPFSAVSYKGDYSAGGFGVVFSTLPFETISTTGSSPNNQNEVMRRIVEFLLGPQTPVPNVDIERPAYGPDDLVLVSVRDAAANADPFFVETLTVSVYGLSDTTPFDMTLTETGPGTSVFEGSVQLAAGAAVPGDGILQVNHGDLILAEYGSPARLDYAVIDAIAPTVFNVDLTAYPTRATITWETDEEAFEQIRVGTSPADLFMIFDDGTIDLNHLMTISGLTPQTQYYYQIVSTDLAGNSSVTSVESFTTTAAQPFLLIDDDLGEAGEVTFINALSANLFTSDAWDLEASEGTPLLDDLSAYQMVIWNVGTGGLSFASQVVIAEYMDNGGKIYISGQDILSNGVNPFFQQAYLKVASFTADVRTVAHTEIGVTGHPIGDGMNLPVAPNGTFGNLFVDGLTPTSDASGFLRHGNTTVANQYSSISYRGNYSSGGYGMVFSTVPMEAMSVNAPYPGNASSFMFRVVDYLIGPLPAIHVSPPTANFTEESGSQVSFTVVLNSQPSAWVYVPVSVSDSTEGAASTSLVAFSSANWFVPQTVTISGVNDFVDDGTIPYNVFLGPASSPDALYNGINPADISLVNTDDDTAGITVGSVSGTTTTELGDKVTFKVRLNSEPLATVSINIWSNDVTEGTVNPGGVQFTAANWFLDQTITVAGVDDSLSDGNIAYTVLTDPAVSLDPLYQGMNAANVNLVNVDDDPVATKFYVVNDSTVDRTYEYDASGSLVENYAVFSANTTPRGIATTAAGALFWVIDANRKVYVYNNSGALQGSWTLGTIPTMGLVEGIATNGTHIWVVDRATRRVYVYLNAASRLSGTQNASTTFSLNPANSVPKDIVFGTQSGQNYLWVVDDGTGYDRVYRYAINSSGIATSNTNWGLSTQNANPTGITVDPSNGTMDIWVSDSGTDRVYRYAGARTSALPTLTDSFALDAANSNPQGIADPPPMSKADSLGNARSEVSQTPDALRQPVVDSPLHRSIFTTSDPTVQQPDPLSRSTELSVLQRRLPSRNMKRLEASQRLRNSLRAIAPEAFAIHKDDMRIQEGIQAASLDKLFANVQISDDLLNRLN